MDCPRCGYAMTDLDTECVRCKWKPGDPVPSRTPTPAPTATPGPAARAPLELTTPQRIVMAFGGFWDIYPWVVLALLVLSIGGAVGLRGAGLVTVLMFRVFPLLWLGAIFWLIVDVLAERASIWWIIGFFFAPVLLVFLRILPFVGLLLPLAQPLVLFLYLRQKFD